jgi:protein-S-isoprenylcysteine O-methyltransferase Ste14
LGWQLPTGLAGSGDRIYLSFIVLVVGLSIWRNDLWLMVTLIPAIAFLATIVIPREKRFLDRNFPAPYSSYKATVRHWL